MNKLVIVGNGFDLAHGLPTSYKHFIDDFWKNINDQITTDLLEVDSSDDWTQFLKDGFTNFKEFEENLKKYENHPIFPINFRKNILTVIAKNDTSRVLFKLNNQFFREINIKNDIENWIDIENEYYQKLKRILKTSSLKDPDKKKAVKVLHIEFDQVKSLFEKYLSKNVNQRFLFKYSPSDISEILTNFQISPRNLEQRHHSDYLLEFSIEDHNDLIEFDNKIIEAEKQIESSGSVSPTMINNCETLFLNFNYTDSVDIYVSSINNRTNGDFYGQATQIQIHGRLDNRNNKINFGFGDEMDDDYKFIENLNEGEYLRNFKSFQYSQNSNYKKLLDFIDSEKFQVYIMGHSCGLSDRTLLNTIFENKNCRSIKVFFHGWENESGKKKDNFTEIIQNISRHFNDKKLMRSKIVNKSLCKLLPQNIRFQKRT